MLEELTARKAGYCGARLAKKKTVKRETTGRRCPLNQVRQGGGGGGKKNGLLVAQTAIGASGEGKKEKGLGMEQHERANNRRLGSNWG